MVAYPRVLISAIVVAWALFASGDGRAAPLQMSYAGQILKDGKPLSGPIAATFTLYGAATGGSAVWSEQQDGIQVAGGLFSALLGAKTPLQLSVFNGEVRWLEVAIGEQTLAPRVPVASVPYALVAANATGDITPRSVTVGGKKVINEKGEMVCPCGACWTRKSDDTGGCRVCTTASICTPAGWVPTTTVCGPDSCGGGA